MTNPVEWAEQEFSAQTVWETLQSANEDLRREYALRAAFAGELRLAQTRLDDLEYHIASRVATEITLGTAPGKVPSEAAITRAVKTAQKEDEGVGSLRGMVTDVKTNLDGCEGRIETLRNKIRSSNYRLEQIAASLRFFASCKDAETQARRAMVSDPSGRWPW